MGFFDSLKRPDINDMLNKLELEEKAVLLDVRTPQEYKSGHIPGSKNIPLDRLQKVSGVVKDKDTAVYVYCQSGGRSRAAASALKQMGYENVMDYGGINRYRGKVV